MFKSIVLLLIFGMIITPTFAVKKMLHPSIKICKRYDPNLSTCVQENFQRLLPTMKYGIPEMNINPIEPVHIETVRMDFPQTQSIKLTADLNDMNVWGMSSTIVNNVTMVEDNTGTFTMTTDVTIPKISMISNYKAVGRFLLLSIDANGNFTGDFDGLRVKSHLTSTIFTKKNRQHLQWQSEIRELTIEKMNIKFNNLFGNNNELTENTNNVINENIDALYDEISPVVKETVNSVAMNAVNNVNGLFPIDVLFPKN